MRDAVIAGRVETVVWSLTGITGYGLAKDLMLKLVEARARDAIGDTVLFLEHAPVITRGRGLQNGGHTSAARSIPLTQVIPPGIEYFEIERGGDLTYHGPGQLVVYPICKLDGSGFGPQRDIAAYLRKLEKVLIYELATMGVVGSSRAGATGVWVGARKIASIGIAVSKWVTYHGMAINCVNDLNPFKLISPCGFNPDVMARLWDMCGHTLPGGRENWRNELELGLARRFRADFSRVMDSPVELSVDEAIRITSGSCLVRQEEPVTPVL